MRYDGDTRLIMNNSGNNGSIHGLVMVYDEYMMMQRMPYFGSFSGLSILCMSRACDD